jgi:membrane-associated phospholipid phosphatase
MDSSEQNRPLDEAGQNVTAPRRGLSLAQRRGVTLVGLLLTLGVFIQLLPEGTRLALLRSLFEQRVVVGVLLTFSLLTLSLLWSAGQRLDAWLFLYVNLRGYHSAWMDRLMRAFTQLGSFGFALLVSAFFFTTGQRRVTVVLMLGEITLWLMVETIKALTDRGRPFTLLEGARVIGWKALGLSFPSGHTAQAFFLATLITSHFQFALLPRVVVYTLACLVGYTRIYVGAHYPRDVLGGALLGSVWGVMAVLVDNYLLNLPV